MITPNASGALTLLLSVTLILSGCSPATTPLIIASDIDAILFMPNGIGHRLKQDMLDFLSHHGLNSLWVEMEGKNDRDISQHIRTAMAHRQVHDRMNPLVLIGFSKGNAGVLAAMGYWGHPPLTENLRAIFLAPPPDEILDPQSLYGLPKGHTMAFVYGTYDQPRRRRLLQQSHINRQTIFETTISARHSLYDYWQGAQNVILDLSSITRRTDR